MSARHNAPITQKQIDRFKQRAKAIKKGSGIPHAEALDTVAREEGFNSWKALINEAEPEDGQNDAEELDFIEENLSPVIAPSLVTENKAYLTKLGIEFAVFIPTDIAFRKSIIDATAPVRTLFELTDFHFYWNQNQGKENKVIKSAVLLSPTSDRVISRISLYRPRTKKGDPRMWFRLLKTIAAPWDEVAIIIFNDAAYLINLSLYRLANCAADSSAAQFLNAYTKSSNVIANELLSKLLNLAKNPIPAIGKGDTAVGMAIEFALGIPANSSKTPDYKGIEIKSARGKKNRSSLFAQVAIWSQSGCKSSAAILEKYGYMRETRKKLYCTVSTQKPNSQGLHFKYSSTKDLLEEFDQHGNQVALWTGELLRARLAEKHAETFWIKAKSEIIDGKEYFWLKSVTHTKSPTLVQLMPLIESGVITMDHLISRDDTTGQSVKEKGPLFKINEHHLNLLFPEPTLYLLA
jgi:hypothetical protein